MTRGVRRQNLRDFTVQIRDATDKIVGTGIVVSTDGKIVTGAHVIRESKIDPRNPNDAEIAIHFPQAREPKAQNRRAKVAKCFAEYDDDVVLLQLTDGPAPLAPDQIAVIGVADESARHTFHTYGYRTLGNYFVGWAGTIMGSVESPSNLTLLVEPVQLDSKQIAPGRSGAGVLNVELNLLVGIISETYYPPSDDPKDRDTAWSVNVRVLSLEPLGLTVRKKPLELKTDPKPNLAQEFSRQVSGWVRAAIAARTAEKGANMNRAPSVPDEWTGRADLIKLITTDWNDPNKQSQD